MTIRVVVLRLQRDARNRRRWRADIEIIICERHRNGLYDVRALAYGRTVRAVDLPDHPLPAGKGRAPNVTWNDEIVEMIRVAIERAIVERLGRPERGAA